LKTYNPRDMASQSGISELHEAARNWAQAGFAVFPCQPFSKIPATPNGLHDATTDLDQIDAWWSENPTYNIGISPARSAMFVLDVDPPLGVDTLAAKTSQHGHLPETLTIRTPRGGLHYWFLGSCPSTVAKLGPKLDTRGEGGYVLVPPSYVRDGKGIDGPYTYEGECNEIRPAPAWIAGDIARLRDHQSAADNTELDLPASVERARTLLRNYVQVGDVAIEGQGGDNRTYQVACEVLALGLSPALTWQVMSDEWNEHCVPPWDEEELAVKVTNAAEYMQNDIGAWTVAPTQEIFAEVARTLTPEPAAPDKLSRFYPHDESEQDQRPEPQWLLPGFLPAESTVMLYGPSGNYKSFLALDIALTLTSGIAGYGCPAREPYAAVFIAAEGSRAIERQRRPAWRLARQIEEPLPFYTIDTMPLIGRPQEVIEVVEQIKRRGIKPKLVVLDTIARAMAGMNENDARDTGEFIEAIELIKRELHCTVLAVHHTGKDEDRGSRGSSALPAAFDAAIKVHTRKETKTVALYVTRFKDADEPEVPWTFEGHVVGPSLVFFEISTAEYRKLSHTEDAYSREKIGQALQELHAIGDASAVTSHVLATHFVPQLQDDKPEDRSRAVLRCVRQLNMLAKGKLEAYTIGTGKSLKWCLPAAPPENTQPEM